MTMQPPATLTLRKPKVCDSPVPTNGPITKPAEVAALLNAKIIP
jgi:hypothetical protein